MIGRSFIGLELEMRKPLLKFFLQLPKNPLAIPVDLSPAQEVLEPEAERRKEQK